MSWHDFALIWLGGLFARIASTAINPDTRAYLKSLRLWQRLSYLSALLVWPVFALLAGPLIVLMEIGFKRTGIQRNTTRCATCGRKSDYFVFTVGSEVWSAPPNSWLINFQNEFVCSWHCAQTWKQTPTTRMDVH